MPRQFTDSENSGDHNWNRLWETPSKKSQRQYARAWVHPLPGDLPISKALSIPKHPIGPSEFTAMTSIPKNLSPEDQFLLWRQEMEAKQREQARQITELHEQANRLQEENKRLRTKLEVGRAEQSREPARPFPTFRPFPIFPPQFTALNIAYDRLLPIIRDLPDFKWPPPMRAGPDQGNRSLRCDYHRDHGHDTNNFQSLKFLVEKLIRVGHLRRYLQEPTHEALAAPPTDRVVIDTEHASGPRPTINFILGGPADSQYQSKKQRRRILWAASVRARVNTVSNRGKLQQFCRLTALYPFLLLTLHKSSHHTMTHSY